MNEPAPTENEGNLQETIARLWGVIVRRRWWILTAGCCIPVAVAAIAMKLPNSYVSQATLLVVQQQISQRYVQPESTTTTVGDVVQAVTLQVLSASRLLAIINDFGLYSAERERLGSELVVERMRRDFSIQAVDGAVPRSDVAGFTITFTAATPHLAQDVTRRLVDLFIEQNQKIRGERAASTTRFLSDQLDVAKQRLAEQEQRLQAFKMSNAGELPEQQQANLVELTNVRVRLEAVTTRLLQVQQQQGSVEASLLDRINRLQSERTQLLTRFTAKYPDVVKKDREIATLQSAIDRLRAGTPAGNLQDESSDDASLAGLLRQADSNRAEIVSLIKQQQQLKSEGEQYQARLNLAPVRQQQLDQILRDYDLNKQNYSELEKNKTQSQMQSSVEENQEGQRFRLLDGPTLAIKPSSPKRLQICLGGMAAGGLLGLLLAFLVDIRNSAFYSEKALAQSYSLPLVLAVPWVRTPAERRAHACRLALEWVVGCAMSVIMLAAQIYVFQKG